MPVFRIFLRTLVVFAIIGLGLPSSATGQDAARTVRETVSLSPEGTVTVDNHEGSISVSTWDREAVRYEARIMPTDEDPTAEKVTIRTDGNDRALSLATVHEDGDDERTVFGFSEDGWQWGGTNIPAVHYTVTIPASASLEIEDHESEIDVTGLQSTIRIDTHDESVEIERTHGDLTIDTHDGPVSITDHRGDVTLDTHESRMDLRSVVGRVVVDTHDGELTADGLDGGLRLDTHDGDTDVSFASLSDDVWIDTHDAFVTLSLPAGTGFDLNTDFGDDVDVQSDFNLAPIRLVDEDDDDEIDYRGDVNGGGPEIYLESHDGDFVLRSH